MSVTLKTMRCGAVLAAVLLAACGGSDEGGSGDAARAGASAGAGVVVDGRVRKLAVTPQQLAASRWSAPVAMSLNPGNVSNLPGGKMALWSGAQPNFFEGGSGRTYSTVYDPASGSFSARLVTETAHEMFCSGTSNLADGSILVAGGQNAEHTSLLDAQGMTWSNGAAMVIPRGYNANATLEDGTVLTLGGSFDGGVGGKDGEVYTPGSGWRRLAGVPVAPFVTGGVTIDPAMADYHMWLLPAGNGKVLHAGPSPNMNWIDPRGNGAVTPAGLRGNDIFAMQGTTVMYDTGRILKVGGADGYHNLESVGGAFVLDINAGLVVRRLPNPAYQRGMHNSVVLPNGQVVLVGGQTRQQGYVDSNAVLVPELFDPVTETFTPLAPMSQARSYHSVAALLPDGRVLAAGGNLGCDNSAGCPAHASLEILSPPYLFNADGTAATRPVITAAPARAVYGSRAAVTTSAPVASFAIVRLSSATHSVNNDQRRLALTHTVTGTNSYAVDIPSNPGWALPGRWMLFAMNAAGVPSVSREIQIDGTGAARIVNPGDQATAVGAAATIDLAVTGATGYAASGLPPGVTMDAATGRLAGTPTAAGSYKVTVSASNAAGLVSTEFMWYVALPLAGSGNGLAVNYYGNTSLAGTPIATGVALPALDSAAGLAPPAGVNPLVFSVRYTGYIEPVASGSTALQVLSDDSVRVWVDGRLVVDHWDPHGVTTDTTTVPMTVGRRVPVMIEYAQAGGASALRLNWQPAGTGAMVAVPPSRLFPLRPSAVVNLALGKPTMQSSTTYNGVSGRAVDGNTDGLFNDGSVIHTDAAQPQSWWQVDLGAASRIDLVQLWNRTDCCIVRGSNLVVFISASDMSQRQLADLQADAGVVKRNVGAGLVTSSIGIPVNAVGRYVRVQALTAEPLNIAEAQVWGATAYSVPVIGGVAAQQFTLGMAVNLALGATDAGGGSLFWGATGLPAGLSIDTVTGVVSGTPTNAGSGTAVLGATNGNGLQSSTTFAWQVSASPVTSVSAPIATSGVAVSYAPALVPNLNAQFSWNFGDGSAATPLSSSAAASHVYAAPGVYGVVLTVRYGDGTSTTYRLLQAVSAPGAATAVQPVSSSSVLVEPRANASARLWVVNADNHSVSVFDTANSGRLAEITVGLSPRTLSRAADGRIWVTNKDGASISIVSPTALAVVQTLTLPRGSQPHGMVVSPADGSVYVALEALGQVLKLDGSTGAQAASLAVGSNPRHLAMTATGDRLLVSRYITRALPGEGTATVSTADSTGRPLGGEVLVVNPSTMTLTSTVVLRHSDRPDLENQGRGIPNYLGAAAIAPDGRSAWVPSKQDNVRRGTLRDGNALSFQNTVRAVSSRLDLAAMAEDTAARIDHDNAGVPSAARYHPSGAYVFVALETNRQVAVVDAYNKRELFRIEAGLAPQGLALSADGMRLYVHNFMSRSVSIIDLSPLVVYGQAAATGLATLQAVTTELLPDNVLKGKQLFYDARDPRLARDSYMSCASCHNEAGHDGRTWDFTGQGEGLRNTPALKGRAGTAHGFVHWSANFDEIQDFEGQIRSFAGGTGLMADAQFNAGTRSTPLGDRKAGLSADLDALAAYLGSLTTFAPSPARNADGSLTAAAQAGKAVFAGQCAGCHGGAGFTDSADAARLKNIGTLKASSGKRLGAALAGIDIPTLRDAWAGAPYLHDGSAPTLAAAVSAHSVVALNATDLANVVAYVQQIGSDEPAAPSNLARGKAALQSSTAYNGAASRAVDDNVDGVYNNASITHTDLTAQPWWQVDLGQQGDIQAVRLWNRTDCCADRLANVTVYVSAADMRSRTKAQLDADATVAKVSVATLNGAPSIALPLVATGRYVRVQLAGTNVLSLAEVQVLGVPANLARGKAATQVSTAYNGMASRALDGNTNGAYNNGSVTHTDIVAQPWWQVDLGQLSSLDSVQLWNRTDCCAGRLSSAVVFVSATDMTGRTLAQLQADPTVLSVPVSSLGQSPVASLPLGGAAGRYLRVQLMGTDYLSLAEVQAHGR